MRADRSQPPGGTEGAAWGYAGLVAFVAIAYALVLGPYIRFLDTVLPHGDPFTYTIGFFQLVDRARGDYLGTLRAILRGEVNFYWLLNVPIAALSPILAKEPYSLAVVNYALCAFALCVLYRAAHAFGASPGAAFAIALIPWFYPVHHGFAEYTGLPVLGLDAAFLSMLLATAAQTCVFARRVHSLREALLAGAIGGLALWGRGNSLPVVGLVALVPALWAAREALRMGRPGPIANVALCAAVAGALGGWFYWANWTGITGYYIGHATFVARHGWNLADAKPYLLNVPGFMFWRAEGSIRTIATSFAAHACILGTIALAFERVARAEIRLLAATGATIYFGTYAANLALFTDPLMNLQNALLIWRPMLIGSTLSAAALALRIWDAAPRLRPGPGGALALGLVALVFGAYWTERNFPRYWTADLPSPREVERFARFSAELVDGRPVSFLWFGTYNPPILRYYAVKTSGKDYAIFRGPHYDDIWSQFDYTPANQARISRELALQFEQAALIAIPEFVDQYHPSIPYAFYKQREEIAALLNGPDARSYVVRMILRERPGVRLLVLQRADEAGGEGEPLRLPYGTIAEGRGLPDYGPKALRFR